MSRSQGSRSARRALVGCGLVALSTTTIGVAPAGAASAPGAPKITSAVAAQQGVTLNFTRPASDGGARIFHFRATCTSTDGGKTVERTAARSPISIAGMSVKKQYTCVVAARNSAGIGPASKPSATFVPLPQDVGQLPDPPELFGVHPVVGTIIVNYKARSYESPRTKLTVIKYRARCYSSNGGVTRRGERLWTQGEIEVRQVTPGKTYECRVAAANSYGWGPYSEPSGEVVPLSALKRPSAPKITSATAIVRGLSVAFVPPVDAGDSPIVDYRIKCTSSNGGEAVARSLVRHSPYNVVGLSVGKTYTCTLAARSIAGVGKFSAPSKPAVPLAD